MPLDYEAQRKVFEAMANNKTRRALICLCIDSSFSMTKDNRINTVNAEIDKFLHSMYANKLARDAVEMCVVSFGDTIEVKCQFGRIEDAIEANRTIEATGRQTRMGAGVKRTLELLDSEINALKLGGNSYYKPWLILISDGEATDETLCKEIGADVLKRQREGSLKVKCLSMGSDSEITSLKSFSIDGEVEQINDIGAMEFFSMLSRSISEVSISSIQAGEF